MVASYDVWNFDHLGFFAGRETQREMVYQLAKS